MYEVVVYEDGEERQVMEVDKRDSNSPELDELVVYVVKKEWS